MIYVIFAASVIATATLIGTAVGYLFKNVSVRTNDAVVGFASGVMLGAAVMGLIEPACDHGGRYGGLIAVAGIFAGALFLYLIDRFAPKLGITSTSDDGKRSGAMLLVAAIAIHHFPEGIAAGVSFGTGNLSDVFLVCGGIAIQNIPEAAVIIAPMLNSGISRGKALVIALISGGMELLGTFFGYFAVSAAAVIMPFALAFAGGSMVYIIVDEMIPGTHSHDFGGTASFSALAGLCVMILVDSLTVMLGAR